ncbi:hypothetical protein DPMN_063018 [Dreissena polymorpha]|uniref:Uncharacterized protein n=1 Tax=Dreissena polymorpha TaxID=45954 RepID=A0A9D4HI86_DREPO|nr:hypothetical protein DPMN_063018 [Dreissena polymorpha]
MWPFVWRSLTLSLDCHYVLATSIGFSIRLQASVATRIRPYYVSKDRIRFLGRSTGAYHVLGTFAAGSSHDQATFWWSSIKLDSFPLHFHFNIEWTTKNFTSMLLYWLGNRLFSIDKSHY